MFSDTIAHFTRPLAALGVTGPIFDKELRVASRRRRNYWFRFVYLVLLTIFVGVAWYGATEGGGSAYQISRMAKAGKIVIATIVWFQFITLQLVALSILGTAISDEVYRRTLGVLFSTPITSLQIVLGKLFSKLLQLVILLALSLPLLALVRVFGGVPWDYIVSSLCITLSALVFAGSLSLYCSITSRQGRQAASRAFGLLALLYIGLPTIHQLLTAVYNIPAEPFGTILMYTSPYSVLSSNTSSVMLAFGPVGSSFSWPLHCLIMLGLSGIVLSLATWRVRKAGLRQALGGAEPMRLSRGRRRQTTGSGNTPYTENMTANASIRPVVGHPVTWKDIRTRLTGQRKLSHYAAIALLVAAIICGYGICIYYDCLDTEPVQAIFIIVYLVLAAFQTLNLAAGCIVAEKEARTLPILLTTPLSDGQILFGKARAVLWRCLPFWALLIAHLLVFSMLGYVHWILLPQLLIIAVSVAAFFLGVGLFFSSFAKRTSSAMNMAFGSVVALWMIVPIFVGIAGGDEMIIFFNPVFQTGGAVIIAVEKAGESLNQLHYDLDMPGGKIGPVTATILLLISAAFYCVVGFLLAALAASQLRQKVFTHAT